MKCRVFKKQDGRVIYSCPTYKYQDKPNFEGCKFPLETKDLPFVDLDASDLPSEEGRDWYSHGPLTMDGDCKKENLKFDETWSIHLMPVDFLRRKHCGRLDKKIDLELEKPIPDQIQLMKWQREKEKCKEWNEKQCLEQAIKNLDEDGHDKPMIREKLAAKIKEL